MCLIMEKILHAFFTPFYPGLPLASQQPCVLGLPYYVFMCIKVITVHCHRYIGNDIQKIIYMFPVYSNIYRIAVN